MNNIAPPKLDDDMTYCDVLIVGQGIAGTFLAHQLEKRGQNIFIVDDGEPNASLTAAGMINPVVLKRFSPVWQGREQIHYARQVVAEMHERLGDRLSKKLAHSFDILRIFHNEKERETWATKAIELDGLLDSRFYPSPTEQLLAPYGVGKVNLGGRIDLHILLSHYREYWKKSGRLLDEVFDYQQLKLKEKQAIYKNIQAHYVVFCEGYGLKQNPYFNHLPLRGNKGEVLTVRIPRFKLTATVKAAVFIMPLPEQGEDVYFIGATYNWTDKNHIPTETGKTELLEKLKKILSKETYESIEILSHKAGMRPTVVDRRPLLGQHVTHQELFIFNGLGTRGVMLGATMAKHLADFMLDKKKLPSVVDIARFS